MRAKIIVQGETAHENNEIFKERKRVEEKHRDMCTEL